MKYDLFVSYRQRDPDKSWVRRRFIPELRRLGLRVCVDYQDFRLGAPLLLEMERAVVESRFTLAVLTPSYLQSNFTELENVWAEHLGLEQTTQRLLLVQREPCSPRLGLRARLWLDLTDDADLADGCARLATEIQSAATLPE